MQRFDIIIVGSGIVGATTALALAKQTSLQIALVDANEISPTWDETTYSARVSAISLASQRIFQRLNVWSELQVARVSPYHKMQVWDANGNGKIDFDAGAKQQPALGYIIEDALIRKVLLAELQKYSHVQLLAPLKILSLQKNATEMELLTEQGSLAAALIIGADGANSWVRSAAKIDLSIVDYQHHALISTVKTSFPHAQTARQRFLSTGPLAFLPLAESHTSSIVWSASPEKIESLLALTDEQFKMELAEAFDQELGAIVGVGTRYHFPLQMRHAKNYVQQGVALVGDAAHTLHPLAGQGVNLGLLDAVTLVEVITNAVDKNRSFASLATLRRYERWRKGDNMAMLAFVRGIQQLFGSELKTIRRLRNTGLNLTNRFDFVKNFFADYAAGNRSDLPALARQIG